ncbi:hypothetical protein LWI28_015218 [Acer negundo]|uniref:Uncharacterized protein n=1 Tax=Acer negundo TaxID=4023 RepID=A0AAD5IMI6_ACENE|nr:hypothetical protein LWI28_015218 [Acer negundo]
MLQQLLERQPNPNTLTGNAPTHASRDRVEGVAFGCPGGGRPPRATRHMQFEDFSDEDSDEDFASYQGIFNKTETNLTIEYTQTYRCSMVGIRAWFILFRHHATKEAYELNPHENQIDEVYELDVIAQLRQQVGTLTQQIAVLTAQKWRPNRQKAEEESDSDEALFIPLQHRQGGLTSDESSRWESSLFVESEEDIQEQFIDFKGGPIFDEEESDEDSDSYENMLSDEYSSQGLTSFHRREGGRGCVWFAKKLKRKLRDREEQEMVI